LINSDIAKRLNEGLYARDSFFSSKLNETPLQLKASVGTILEQPSSGFFSPLCFDGYTNLLNDIIMIRFSNLDGFGSIEQFSSEVAQYGKGKRKLN
jgi:hypothetical protein